MRHTALIMMATAAAVLFCSGAAGEGCGSGEDESRATPAADPADAARPSNLLGFGLLRELSGRTPSENVFVSPTSVSMALAMAANGAAGETLEEMAALLTGEGTSLDDLNRSNEALRASLETADVRLSIANSLWRRLGFPLRPGFVKTNAEFYDAALEEIDFSKPGAASSINDWVRDETSGRIESIVDRISPETMLYILNAVYFKGLWTDPFDAERTRPLPFATADGRSIEHPMMTESGRYPYYEADGIQAISLPYGEGRMSMVVVLPSPDTSIEDFVRGLGAEQWDRWVEGLRKREGEIVLPRFTIEYEEKLNDALAALGMVRAFDLEKADFSAMSALPLYVDEVRHKTFVEVNEEGTEAAAVTSVSMALTAVAPSSRFRMVVDRPFVCAIRDGETGALVFLGVIADPAAGPAG